MKTLDVREVAFMGRITAGFTHEMKNVLAIIKESAGLMEDLIALTPEGSFPQRERFSRVLGKILEQVQRGVNLSTRLNRFAHSPDEPIAVIDLNDMGEQVAILTERFARLKGVTLKMVPAGEKLLARTSPVAVIMALFHGMEICWDRMKAGSELELRGEKRAGEVLLHMLPTGDFGDPDDLASGLTASDKWADFQEMVSSLEGRVERSASGAGFAVVFKGNTE